MVNIGNLEVVVGQLCITESVYRFRNWLPNVIFRVFILMPHLGTDPVFSSKTLATVFPMPERSELELCFPNVPEL